MGRDGTAHRAAGTLTGADYVHHTGRDELTGGITETWIRLDEARGWREDCFVRWWLIPAVLPDDRVFAIVRACGIDPEGWDNGHTYSLGVSIRRGKRHTLVTMREAVTG